MSEPKKALVRRIKGEEEQGILDSSSVAIIIILARSMVYGAGKLKGFGAAGTARRG